MIEYGSIRDGRTFESANPVEVTSELIANFCAAIGDTNPLYTDPEAAKAGPHGGLVAPPSLAAIFGDGENIFQHFPKFDTRRLAAGMDVEFLAPIRAGDSITTVSWVKEVYEKTGRSGAMVFIVISSTLRKQNGEIAARIEHRFTTPL
ncbi:MAG: MaoC family dehydratase [Bryobacteraceae bacterium]